MYLREFQVYPSDLRTVFLSPKEVQGRLLGLQKSRKRQKNQMEYCFFYFYYLLFNYKPHKKDRRQSLWIF